MDKRIQFTSKKASLPTLISNVKIGIKYFGNKKIKDITIHEYQSFLNDYAIGRKKQQQKEPMLY